jgi:hypothetical protein
MSLLNYCYFLKLGIDLNLEGRRLATNRLDTYDFFFLSSTVLCRCTVRIITVSKLLTEFVRFLADLKPYPYLLFIEFRVGSFTNEGYKENPTSNSV